MEHASSDEENDGEDFTARDLVCDGNGGIEVCLGEAEAGAGGGGSLSDTQSIFLDVILLGEAKVGEDGGGREGFLELVLMNVVVRLVGIEGSGADGSRGTDAPAPLGVDESGDSSAGEGGRDGEEVGKFRELVEGHRQAAVREKSAGLGKHLHLLDDLQKHDPQQEFT